MNTIGDARKRSSCGMKGPTCHALGTNLTLGTNLALEGQLGNSDRELQKIFRGFKQSSYFWDSIHRAHPYLRSCTDVYWGCFKRQELSNLLCDYKKCATDGKYLRFTSCLQPDLKTECSLMIMALSFFFKVELK